MALKNKNSKPAKRAVMPGKKLSDMTTKKPAGASKITAADKAKAAQKIKTMQPAKPKGAVARGKATGAASVIKEHQKDLTEMSARAAASKAFKKTKNPDASGMAYGNTRDKMMKSFGLKSKKSQY